MGGQMNNHETRIPIKISKSFRVPFEAAPTLYPIPLCLLESRLWKHHPY
jgi:hypothetical protein